MQLPYALADVKRILTAAPLARGREYAALERVAGFAVSADGADITASVQGSGEGAYKVNIRCQAFKGGTGLQGFCTCPMRFNCKHVAAVLLHGLAQTGAIDIDGAAQEADGSTPREGRGATAQLEPALRAWLDAVEPAPMPERVQERNAVLAYVLSREQHHGIRLLLYTARPRKDGSLGSGQALQRGIGDLLRESPGYIAPEDVVLLEQLLLLSLGSAWAGIAFTGPRALALIGPLAASGRLFWRKPSNSAPLRLGPARKAQLRWSAAPDGAQSVQVAMSLGAELLPLSPPWYVDPVSGEIGPIDTTLPDALAGKLVLAPRVQPHEVEAVRASLQRSYGDQAPLPRALKLAAHDDVQPVTWLRLWTLETESYHRRAQTEALDVAELRFAYDGVIAGVEKELRRLDGDTLHILRRNAKAEENAARKLKQLGLHQRYLHIQYEAPKLQSKFQGAAFAPPLIGNVQDAAEFWLRFVQEDIPALKKLGWQVESDASFRFNLATDVRWYGLTEEAGNDWFELELGVEIEGQRVSLLPALAQLLATLSARGGKSLEQLPDDQKLYVTLPDKRILPITLARLRPLAALLIELYDRGGSAPRVRLSRFDAARVSELEGAVGVNWAHASARLRTLGEKLRGFAGLREIAPPGGLRAQLRFYQREGLNWLQFLREYELAGILADDMGLGKTMQTLAHLLVEKASGRSDLPSLVVAPTSLMYNWSAEAARYAPDLRVLRLQGQARKRDFERISEFDLVLSTYPLLARDKDVLSQQPFHYVILDEAQNIKNAKTQAAIVARQLNARHRLCLTGTPLENHLGELWSLFHFLLPGFLGSEEQFRDLYRTPIEKGGNVERQRALAKRVAPFLLRRSKDQVAKELPAKTEIPRSVELQGAQRDLYETLRVAMHEKVQQEIAKKGLARSHIVILEALLKLRQACCDPRLVKLDRAKTVKESAKLELLMALLPQLIEEGRKVLVFSQFTSMLALIEPELEKHGIAYSLLTGETRERAAQIEAFQSGTRSVFLLSLKAGGVGLNLTAADTVIHYDPWWNPQVERQATDRAHRIGQDKPVFVYKLIAAGSVEEKIVALQEKKAALVRGVLEQDSAALITLTSDDLRALFEPIA